MTAPRGRYSLKSSNDYGGRGDNVQVLVEKKGFRQIDINVVTNYQRESSDKSKSIASISMRHTDRGILLTLKDSRGQTLHSTHLKLPEGEN